MQPQGSPGMLLRGCIVAYKQQVMEDMRLMVGFSWHFEIFPNPLAPPPHPRLLCATFGNKKQAASADWMGWLKITHEYKWHRKSNSRFLLKSSQTQAVGEMVHSILFEVLMKRLAAQKHSEWADGEAKYGLRGGDLQTVFVCACQRGVCLVAESDH